MKEGLGTKLICEAAEVFMYSDEELRRELPAQEAEELIELHNSFLTGPAPEKNINREQAPQPQDPHKAMI